MTKTQLLHTQQQLCVKLMNTGWYEKLRFFLTSSDLKDILQALYEEKEANRRFSPPLNDIFKAFELCPFDKLQVIFVNKEPYTDPMVNNGLAISHKDSLVAKWEFRAFYEELQRTVGWNTLNDANLSPWAEQGLLLLNESLTAQVGRENRHEAIWNPFLNAVLDKLNRDDRKLVWVFFDDKHFDTIDNPNHIKFKVPALPKERGGKWESGDIFNQINLHTIEKIIW